VGATRWLVGALREAPSSPIARIFARAVREPPLQHAYRGSQGPLFQYPYGDRFVRHEKEFNKRLEYMHLNPVKKGLVKRREYWRWSSYNHFASDKATVACLLQIDDVRLPLGYRA
jgi:hypothetical protein